ncbi:MAG: hypothetical protein DWQ35_02410 [Planctomycetota bacterium]|nr:MAG: hypothetical protein DWQ35_02410 [Planctomycetota bacterium]REK27658.1 MAG: hypothetical protein DWQ42_06760 [Planctomycetota bacterium]REK38499.1 MAG: hypothetical protein DWQ46_20425 [Planctomycetota bacterium]
MNTEKPRRRWCQFRLRTLLIAITLISLPLSWLAWEIQQRRRQRPAVEWIRNIGGLLNEEMELYFVSPQFSPPPKPLSERFQERFDEWFGPDVRKVYLWGLNMIAAGDGSITFQDDEPLDLTLLSRLENLEELHIVGPMPKSLSPLEGMSQLRVISINEPRLTVDGFITSETFVVRERDYLEPLLKLDNLERLVLHGLRLDDVGPLTRLKQLRSISLVDGFVEDEQLQLLQEALPDCQILTFEFPVSSEAGDVPADYEAYEVLPAPSGESYE